MKYLIRHAEKTDSSVHAKLSEQGKIDSLNYGKQLQKNNVNIEMIVTSPIDRCVQTAEKIIEGLNKDVTIVKAEELGDPGVYISDDIEAMNIFEKFNLIEIINMQLSMKNLNGFHDLNSASQRLKYFMDRHEKHTIFISHDAVIIPYISWLENVEKIYEADLINYLFEYEIK
ncbi:histidine phosphatase family protein [Sulfurimonas sp.]|uniref:histidine phosphatase family protein n=1 Tax=Sulfurimonas sp. TaxID=2022749 RepID=UPI003563268C